jgi:signal transduction histidine kinase
LRTISRPTLAHLATRTAEAVADVRRVVYALRPPSLDELGLVGALRQAVDSYAMGRLRIVVDVPNRLPALPAAVEVAAYRIAQEALTNVLRHAAAHTCRLRVAVDPGERELSVLVEDDGRGIADGRQGGVGLHSMPERASELGGRCEIGHRPDGGTRVYATLPIHSPHETSDG